MAPTLAAGVRSVSVTAEGRSASAESADSGMLAPDLAAKRLLLRSEGLRLVAAGPLLRVPMRALVRLRRARTALSAPSDLVIRLSASGRAHSSRRST
jgi:hypothetical protein